MSPSEVRFALSRDVNPLETIKSMNVSANLENYMIELLDIIDDGNQNMRLMGSEYREDSGGSQTKLDEFLIRCKENLNNPYDLHRISVATAVSISSRQVLANIHSNDDFLRDLGLGDPSTMAMRWDKVFAIDAIGGIMGGAVGAAGASCISMIMMS